MPVPTFENGSESPLCVDTTVVDELLVLVLLLLLLLLLLLEEEDRSLLLLFVLRPVSPPAYSLPLPAGWSCWWWCWP